ncbi:MAG TPA: OmpH family outer membrane protein [Candidatus Binatia bacterium]|nr:OmpH family outer membrane protein [Candidatus Binatia bacterium]
MKSKFVRAFLAPAAVSLICGLSSAALTVSAAAQTTGIGSALPSAPSAASSTPAAPAANTPSTIATGSGSKVGTINIEQAVFASNEGQRDFEALRKKLEPKQNELKSQNDELDALQKQLQTQEDKLNEDARATLVKQIETKKKSFDRSVQDAQEDAQNQQKEIFQRILQKMAPVIVKHAQDGGFAMIVDTSNQWPQSPILWYGEQNDITKVVVDLYNTQSGVPAPAPAGTGTKIAPKPAAPKPTTSTPTKPQ